MKYAILACLLLTGCISYPTTELDGHGGVIVATDTTGCTFNDAGYALWQREGVPASFFTTTAQGHHITNQLYHEANSIRYKVPAPAPTKPGS